MVNRLKCQEQAFEVYASIYTRSNPDRAPEVFQYIFTIKEVSNTFLLDNVYHYDTSFRTLMEQALSRKWNVILQQVWSLYLKGKLEKNNGTQNPRNFSGSWNGRKRRG